MKIVGSNGAKLSIVTEEQRSGTVNLAGRS